MDVSDIELTQWVWVVYQETINRSCVSFVEASESWRAGYNKACTTNVYYFSVNHTHAKKKNNDIVWAVKYMILELKLNLELNAHFCPPSFECAFLLPIAEPAAIIRILIHSYGILIAHWRVHQRNKNPVVQFSKAVYILHWEIPFF